MRILLATDGTPAANGAVKMAGVLGREPGAAVDVVRVMAPLPVYGPGAVGTLSFGTDEAFEARSSAARDEVKRSITGIEPGGGWPVRVIAGPVPLSIVQFAQERGSSLILLGCGRHAWLERWFGTETALRVAQLSHVPVLAIPPDGGGRRPRVIVAAVDFSTFSRDALATALTLSAPDAEIHLAHVIQPVPADFSFTPEPDAPEKQRARLRIQLGEWAAALDGLGKQSIHLHVLDGEAAEEVLSLTGRVEADLLVAGSHGLGFFGRVLLGSTSSRLLRGAACSVLVAPPSEPASGLAGYGDGTRERLKEFTPPG